jgi:hypothetical protein
MIIKQLAQVILSVEKQGRNRATDKTYSVADISQLIRLGYTSRARDLYYQNKKMGLGNEYYFYSGLLSIQRFKLGKSDLRGKRFLDMTGIDIFRMPKNENFTSLWPVGSCCGPDDPNWEIVQVEPGESKFYLGPDFQFFKFYEVKANGLDTYHIPECVEELDVETTFDRKDDMIDIPMDIAFEVAWNILGWELKIKQFRTASPSDNPYQTTSGADLRRRMAEESVQSQPQ